MKKLLLNMQDTISNQQADNNLLTSDIPVKMSYKSDQKGQNPIWFQKLKKK